MRELVDALVRSAAGEGMELYGVHVYRRGAEPVEHRLRSDDRVDVRSVSKTFTSVALGIAEAEGRLALDDPALVYYPELAGSAAPGLDQVTLRHLLTMTSGSPHSWSAYDPVVVPDLAADFFATPLAHEPGTYFSYTGIGPYIAARALRVATGANVRDYLLPRLFTPLGIHNPQWHTCPLGHPVAESALHLTTSELARFGRLLLDEGRHEGRQLIPAEYCARIATETVSTVRDPAYEGFRLSDRYGLGVWCTPGDRTYKMAGRYGQLCIVCPDKEAVVTVTAHVEGGSGRTSITALVDEEIVSRL
ncbi:beta-lactamase family protein [Actinospica sp. MGRD01-02]|uniref:Beta-lactamase family protein n=1 Tax=Actinospica acidithermotolerans TaxID=2828514 RepID=A0A941EF47_9ACTN|nr:serine hydrolase domain-containing protein [Actinospica acidithermotolerans]MBR7826579.1 beta-lactamase family protein [Actinospica acidithermotolerans]